LPAHEQLDGAGYHRRPAARDLDTTARLLAAADRYQAMCQPRAYRAALTADAAATQLRADAAVGHVDTDAAEAVLAAAGHRRQEVRRTYPAGLTDREVDVLRLVSRGLTTKQVAQELTISPKTADHHLQRCYAKVGVSTRGALALYAVEHDLL
jgi:DNA-binding CsgD family transcriptional regulator